MFEGKFFLNKWRIMIVFLLFYVFLVFFDFFCLCKKGGKKRCNFIIFLLFGNMLVYLFGISMVEDFYFVFVDIWVYLLML